MKKVIFYITLFGLLGACAQYVVTGTPESSQSSSNQNQGVAAINSPRPTETPSLVPPPTENPYLAVSVKQTEVALEQEKLNQELQQISANQAALNIQLTMDSATSTGIAAVTQTAQAGVQVTQAVIARIASEQTQQAVWAPEATRAAAIEQQKYYSTVANIWIGKIILWGMGLSILFGLSYLGYLAIRGLYFKWTQMEPNADGRFNLVPEHAIPGAQGSKRLINPNLAHRVTVSTDTDDLTAEQALVNTQSQRQLEATRAIAQSPTLMRKLTSGKASAETDPNLPNANVNITKPGMNYLTDGNMLTPEWSIIQNWNGDGGIPYGVSSQGLERVSIQQVPHGGIFGQTGKGKSRYFLRPFIAGAIASGQRVIILGKQADFWPFAQHPNVKMIPVRHITQEGEAARYAEYLKRIVEEMNRRDDYLTANHVSTWDRAGRENTLIVLDELGNALDMMPREIAQEAHRWVQGLVKEGRKAGFNVWLASQRAVGFKSIVEQLGRAVFYLADADASRHALGFPGAEQLSDGHFFAKFHGVRKCAAFDPSDEELVTFLKGRNVKTHEPIEWIDAEVISESPATSSSQPAPQNIPDRAEAERDLKILDMHLDGISQAEIERTMFGRTGGDGYYKVKAVIDRYKNTSTTGNMPASEPVGAWK